MLNGGNAIRSDTGWVTAIQACLLQAERFCAPLRMAVTVLRTPRRSDRFDSRGNSRESQTSKSESGR